MKQTKRQLKIEAELSQLDAVLGFLEETLEEAGCPLKVVTQICVSVEEIFVNIANYAYPEQGGDCVMDLTVCRGIEGEKSELMLLVSDFGKQFNPLAKKDPDITLSAEERDIGGLGIWMVKQSMDRVEYKYENEQNQLLLVKSWE